MGRGELGIFAGAEYPLSTHEGGEGWGEGRQEPSLPPARNTVPSPLWGRDRDAPVTC